MFLRAKSQIRPGLAAYFLLHILAVLAFFNRPSWLVLAFAAGLYLLRMFAITAFYHRYFSHRSYRTSRPFQFLMGAATCTAGQRGPLWWAGHHRHHHAHSDTHDDVHSPRLQGVVWAHTLWFMPEHNYRVRWDLIRDWTRYPELVLLEKLSFLPPMLLAGGMYWLGEFLAVRSPSLGTNGWQFLTWGFALSTVVLYHATYCINSIAHLFGSRRFDTPDDSRNNYVLAIVTLGEGWHNNHHRYPTRVRQGLVWWEVDFSYYALKVMSWVGLVWGFRDGGVTTSDLAAFRQNRRIAARPVDTESVAAVPSAVFGDLLDGPMRGFPTNSPDGVVLIPSDETLTVLETDPVPSSGA